MNRLMMIAARAVAVFVALQFFVSLNASAIPVPKGSVSAGGFFAPKRTLGESVFGEKDLMAQGTIRLWSQASPDPFARHSSLSLTAKYMRQNFQLLEGETFDVQQARVGLGGATLSRKDEVYLIRLNAGFSEETDVNERIEVQPGGMALGTRRLNERTNILIGGGYSYLFGRGLLLPAVGAVAELSGESRHGAKLTVLFPFFLHFQKKFSQTAEASLFLRVSGQRTRVRLNDSEEAVSEVTHLRLQRLRFGGAFKQTINGWGGSWGGQTGVEFLRRVVVEGGPSVRPEPGFFLVLSFQKEIGSFEVADTGRIEIFRDLDALLPWE